MRRIAKSIISSWIAHKNTSASAAIAFYTIFSITPLLAIGVGAAGLFISTVDAKNVIVSQIYRIASPEAAAIVKTVLMNFQVPETGRFASTILVFLMIYSASMVFDELSSALNRIFGLKRQENQREQFFIYIKGRLISGLFAFSAGFLVVANFFVSTFLTVFEKFIDFFPQFTEITSLNWIVILNQCVSFFVVALIFLLFFRFLPRKKPTMLMMIPGIIISAFLFECGKYLLKLYLTRTMMASSFGAGGTLVAAIVWVYYSVQIILLGAEISNYIENRSLHNLPKSIRRLKRNC